MYNLIKKTKPLIRETPNETTNWNICWQGDRNGGAEKKREELVRFVRLKIPRPNRTQRVGIWVEMISNDEKPFIPSSSSPADAKVC